MMTRRKSVYPAVTTAVSFFLAILLLVPCAGAKDSRGMEWLEKIDRAESVEHSYAVVRQTITTTGGSERVLSLKAWSAGNGDRSLMVYTDPPRVRGDKILLRDGGDNIWYYMKRRDVIRHFTGSSRRQSAMGSDFAYEDLSRGELVEDYAAELLGTGELDGCECVKLKCIPTESGPSYDHLVLWAGKEDALTRRIDYYDEDGLLKTLTITDFKTIEGRKIGMRMEMKNHREGSRTVMVYEDVTFRESPDPNLFTRSSLTREIK